MKKIGFLTTLIIILLNLTSCNNKNKLERINLVLDWLPNTNHTGIYVAKDLEYFKEEGIDLNINEPPEDSAITIVASGKSQFGIDFQDSLAMAFSKNNEINVTAIAAIMQHNTSGLISLKNKNILTPKDLEYKTYASWNGPLELPILKYIMEKDNADFEKLNIVFNTALDVVSALNSNIDAMWVYYSWDGIVAEIKELETNFIEMKNIDPIFDYYTPLIIANNDYINTNYDTTKRFLNAIQKGYIYSINNPEESANILLKYNPELNQDITIKSQIWISQQLEKDLPSWGYIDNNRWNSFYSWLYKNKITNCIPENYGFTNKFLM